jgi:hypothetical protein
MALVEGQPRVFGARYYIDISSTPGLLINSKCLQYHSCIVFSTSIAAKMEAVQQTTVDALLGKRTGFVFECVNTVFTFHFLH